jgi:hypothetical protein
MGPPERVLVHNGRSGTTTKLQTLILDDVF